MRTRSAKYSAVVAVVLAALALPDAARVDPFDALLPDVRITQRERTQLDAGETVVRVTPGRDGFLSLTAAVRINATSERLLAWAASVEALQKGRYVPEIGRFSASPSIGDLNGLAIEADDLDDLARCRVGDCEVKLSAEEIGSLGVRRSRPEMELVMRRLLVQRAADYLAHGDACVLPYHDDRQPVAPAVLFQLLLRRIEFFPRRLPCYAAYLEAFPNSRDDHVRQSFVYWSKETLGMKPIISITHFSAARFDAPGLPDAVVVAKQIYATHYKNASITVTALLGDASGRYLVYVNRSHVDAFQGFFGGMVRRIVERRVKSEAPEVLHGLRRRLESGDPPRGTNVAH
jgi:hypothetical protein